MKKLLIQATFQQIQDGDLVEMNTHEYVTTAEQAHSFKNWVRSISNGAPEFEISFV